MVSSDQSNELICHSSDSIMNGLIKPTSSIELNKINLNKELFDSKSISLIWSSKSSMLFQYINPSDYDNKDENSKYTLYLIKWDVQFSLIKKYVTINIHLIEYFLI